MSSAGEPVGLSATDGKAPSATPPPRPIMGRMRPTAAPVLARPHLPGEHAAGVDPRLHGRRAGAVARRRGDRRSSSASRCCCAIFAMVRWNARLERRRDGLGAAASAIGEAYRRARGQLAAAAARRRRRPAELEGPRLAARSSARSASSPSVVTITAWATIAGLLVLPGVVLVAAQRRRRLRRSSAPTRSARRSSAADLALVAVPIVYVLVRWMTEGHAAALARRC